MTHGERSTTSLKVKYPQAMENMPKAVAWMKKNKNTLSEEYWSLIPMSCNDFRDANKKNASRDYPKYASAALVEQLLVEQYRQDLLQSSASAKYLRWVFKQLVDQYIKPQEMTITDKGEKFIVQTTGWYYVDGLGPDDTADEVKAPVIDLKHIFDARNKDQTAATMKKQYTQAMSKLQGLSALAASHETKLLHPDIHRLLNELDVVCHPLAPRVMYLTDRRPRRS